MSFASALNVLRPTLPYYVALTKYGLLRITKDCFEFCPHRAAPPPALEMAKAVFTMGASSCTESYVISRMLSEGPKVFAFDALTCEALENFDLSVSTAVWLDHLSERCTLSIPVGLRRCSVGGSVGGLDLWNPCMRRFWQSVLPSEVEPDYAPGKSAKESEDFGVMRGACHGN